MVGCDTTFFFFFLIRIVEEQNNAECQCEENDRNIQIQEPRLRPENILILVLHTSKFLVSRSFFFCFFVFCFLFCFAFFFVFNSVWTCWSIHSTIIKSTSKRKTIYLTQLIIIWKDIYFQILTILHFRK